MSAFYDRMAATALRLITEFGQSVTIREVTPGTYDPVTGEDTGEQVIDQIAQGILLDFTGQEYQANSLIKSGDKKLQIAASGLSGPPSLLGTVIIRGDVWSVVPPLKEINPAGTPLLYELQVRQ